MPVFFSSDEKRFKKRSLCFYSEPWVKWKMQQSGDSFTIQSLLSLFALWFCQRLEVHLSMLTYICLLLLSSSARDAGCFSLFPVCDLSLWPQLHAYIYTTLSKRPIFVNYTVQYHTVSLSLCKLCLSCLPCLLICLHVCYPAHLSYLPFHYCQHLHRSCITL